MDGTRHYVAIGCCNTFTCSGPAPVRSEQTEPVARAIQLLPTRINTKTVYGFLDFTTTVSNTVMIFKPSKASGKLTSY